LPPRVPKTFTIQYSGPPNNTAASYQGVIFATAVGGTSQLAVTPYAFVNLKVGGAPAVAPQFVVDGVGSDYVAFPGFAGADDSNRSRCHQAPAPNEQRRRLRAGRAVLHACRSGWFRFKRRETRGHRRSA